MSIQTQNNVAILEKLKEPSKIKVVIHDNPITAFEEVIFIVSRCFDKTEEEASAIASKVHSHGRGVCGLYTKEIAETKMLAVDMAKSFLIANFPFRRDAIMALRFTMEEA